ncbi:hypothetical protein X777_14220, partial [Ooceraea biroi]
GDCAGGCKVATGSYPLLAVSSCPLPLTSTTRGRTTSLMESSFFSRKMFIGGLSWQTSPGMWQTRNSDHTSPTDKPRCTLAMAIFIVRTTQMTVVPGHPVYPFAFPRVDLPSEGTDGSAMVNVVLNMYAPVVAFARSTNTLIREHLVLLRLADLEQEAPCADTRTLERIS